MVGGTLPMVGGTLPMVFLQWQNELDTPSASGKIANYLCASYSYYSLDWATFKQHRNFLSRAVNGVPAEACLCPVRCTQPTNTPSGDQISCHFRTLSCANPC